jgi:hypothetical protein
MVMKFLGIQTGKNARLYSLLTLFELVSNQIVILFAIQTVFKDPTNYVPKYGADYDYSMTGILAGYVAKPPLYWVLGLNNVTFSLLEKIN